MLYRKKYSTTKSRIAYFLNILQPYFVIIFRFYLLIRAAGSGVIYHTSTPTTLHVHFLFVTSSGLEGKKKHLKIILSLAEFFYLFWIQEIDKVMLLLNVLTAAHQEKGNQSVLLWNSVHFLFSWLSEHSRLLNMQSIQIGLLELL